MSSSEAGRKGSIPLSEMVQSLRAEVQDSIAQSKDQPLRFSVEKIELELNVEVTRDVGGQGKIQFWVLSGGASASQKSASKQTFRLTLLPVSADGGKPLISGETSERPE